MRRYCNFQADFKYQRRLRLGIGHSSGIFSYQFNVPYWLLYMAINSVRKLSFQILVIVSWRHKKGWINPAFLDLLMVSLTSLATSHSTYVQRQPDHPVVHLRSKSPGQTECGSGRQNGYHPVPLSYAQPADGSD